MSRRPNAVVLYLGSEYGGGGEYVKQLLRALNELQMSGTLITFHDRLSEAGGAFAAKVFEDNVMGWLKVMSLAFRLAYGGNCTIIAADHRSVRLLPFMKALSKKAVGIYFLQTSLSLKRDVFRTLFRKLLFYFVDTICGVSQLVLNDVEGIGYKGNTAVVYTSISTADIGMRRDEFKNGDRVVLLPARIVEGKGHIDLIKASAGREWDIWFAGDGEYRDYVMSICRDNKKIKFLGWVSNMRDLYMKASVVVLPSYSEGLPIVLLEAMACGCPVVAYDLDSIKEIVEHGVTGLLVGKGDFKALGDAIQKILDDEEYASKLAGNAAAFVRQKHSVRCMANALDSALRLTTGGDCEVMTHD
jgi:glycosyltransferase involved in cell wall biosynthesis